MAFTSLDLAASAALAQDVDSPPARPRSTSAWPATPSAKAPRTRSARNSTGSTAASPAPPRLFLFGRQQEFRHHLERGPVQGIHQGSEGQDSRHQDGLRRHQERERDQRSLGLRLAIRQGRQDQVQVGGYSAQGPRVGRPARSKAVFGCREHGGQPACLDLGLYTLERVY